MKITIPHIHEIEGADFWARVTRTEELKFQPLLSLRQIEGILIGKKYFEIPMVVSNVTGARKGNKGLHALNLTETGAKLLLQVFLYYNE